MIAPSAHLEKTCHKYFQKIPGEQEPVFDESVRQILDAYGMRVENTGASMENILESHYLKKYHPDIALFVQTSPAFRCPAPVTEAMASAMEKITGTPETQFAV